MKTEVVIIKVPETMPMPEACLDKGGEGKFVIAKREKLVLDVPLFLKRYGKRKASDLEKLLSGMDTEDLSVNDLMRLTRFAAPTVSEFMDEYCVLEEEEKKDGR